MPRLFPLLLLLFPLVAVAAPAQRIVSLAPHITELLFAAGAGTKVVGAVDYSDYPEAARAVPRVGGYRQLDLEGIVALRPDLVVGWDSGNPRPQLERLEALGLHLITEDPHRLEDIPAAVERLGALAGTDEAAQAAAGRFREELARLRARYGGRPPVRVLYQIWDRPLMTVNGEHLISDVIRLCGGENVFAGLSALAPQLDVEAVLAADPEAIAASGMDEARPEWLDMWRAWPKLTATARDNLFFIPPDLIQRHTPRILQGAARLCDQLEQARSRRGG
ncbi:cobalamin-binding protein [Endothiovibrio diazotrophicus]